MMNSRLRMYPRGLDEAIVPAQSRLLKGPRCSRLTTPPLAPAAPNR
jgi:hypothetical protein